MTQQEVLDLSDRIRRGERGDDVPILMADAGCDYDTACDLVFGRRIQNALDLLGAAILTTHKVTP